MERKKGFTLVELLAVIIVLAIILVIAVPAVLNARDRALGTLSKEQEKNLQDAGKLLGVDLDDYATDIFDCKTGSWIVTTRGVTCSKNSDGWNRVKIDVPTLVEHGYFRDDDHHCSGYITIDKTSSGYNVTNNDVKC